MQRTHRSLGTLCAALFVLALVLWAAGCKVVRTTASVPARTVSVFFPGGKSTQPDPDDLQQSLMRFAGAYSMRTAQSVEELVGVPGSPFTAEASLRFKIATVGGMCAIATGQNPYADLLDMVVVTSLTRMTLENQWVTATNGTLFEPWLGEARELETNIWAIADQVLSADQQGELRSAIKDQYGIIVDTNQLATVVPQDLLMSRALEKERSDNASIFGLASLDPLSGLDPAVREITETRLFAERAMFTLTTMPWLLRWQSELLVLEATSQPKVAQVIEDGTRLTESVDRASRAAETISETAKELPSQIAAERKAILDALETQEGQLNALLQSGTAFSDSLTVTLTNFDALMKRFGVGEPETNTPPPAADTRPFDILDYAKTAEQMATLAKELNQTINELNTTIDSPALQKLSSQATSDARAVLNHAFMLAVGLAVCVLICAVIYRRATKAGASTESAQKK